MVRLLDQVDAGNVHCVRQAEISLPPAAIRFSTGRFASYCHQTFGTELSVSDCRIPITDATGAANGAGIRRTAMKMSHLANFVLIIIGGAFLEAAGAVRRGWRGRRRG